MVFDLPKEFWLEAASPHLCPHPQESIICSHTSCFLQVSPRCPITIRQTIETLWSSLDKLHLISAFFNHQGWQPMINYVKTHDSKWGERKERKVMCSRNSYAYSSNFEMKEKDRQTWRQGAFELMGVGDERGGEAESQRKPPQKKEMWG